MLGFLLAFGITFAAELGDKTQILALCYATRFGARTVLVAILAGTVSVHIIAVLVGGIASKWVSSAWLGLFAGLALVGFGF